MPRLTNNCVLLLAFCLLLPSCAGSQKEQPAAAPAPRVQRPATPPVLPALPPPSELSGLLPQREASAFAEADLILQAEAFNPAFPNQRVTADADGAVYEPDFNEITNFNQTRLSYAMYICLAPGYDRGPSITLSWHVLPQVPEDVYIGLAHWDSNRWDWFQGSSANEISFPSSDPYFDLGGAMLITVMQIGEDENELDRLHVGNQAPSAVFTVTRAFGLVPLSVDFDASASSDPEEPIAEYRWDPDGDGVFDQTSGSDPHFNFVYAAAGPVDAGLQVLDADRIAAVAQKKLGPSAGFRTSYGRPDLEEEGNCVVSGTDGSVFVLGDLRLENFNIEAFMAKFDCKGNPIFVRTAGGLDFEEINDATLGADGFIYACGRTRVDGTNIEGLLQKWSQDGELIWSKACGQEEEDRFRAVTTFGSGVYACGYSNVVDVQHALICAFTEDGEIDWASRNDAVEFSELRDIVARDDPILGEGFTLRCCGRMEMGVDHVDMLYTLFTDAGACEEAQHLGLAGFANMLQGNSICVASSSPVLHFTYVAGEFSNLIGTDSVLTKIGGSAVRLGEPGNQSVNPLTLLSLGGNGMRMLSSNQADAHRGALVTVFDLDLGLSEVDMIGTSVLGNGIFPRGMDHFGTGYALTGSAFRDPPEDMFIDPDLDSSSLVWQDLAFNAASIVLSVADQSTATTDVSADFELNRQGDDGDLFVSVEP